MMGLDEGPRELIQFAHEYDPPRSPPRQAVRRPSGGGELDDEAWRTAYRGIIPGPELDKLINRRGEAWWGGAIRKGSRISVLMFGDTVAGYANYGRNRARSLAYDGEIYELVSAAGISGPWFWPPPVQRGAARSRAERHEEPGGVGAVRQRAGGRVLPGAGRHARSRARPKRSAARCSTRSPTPGAPDLADTS